MTYFAAHRLGIVGLGNMGGAIARGAIDAGLVPTTSVVGFDTLASAGHDLPIWRVDTLAEIAERADCIVVAVKPAWVPEVVARLTEHGARFIISIAAGVPLARLRDACGEHPVQLVRAMPNMAASVGASATAIVAEPGADQTLLDAADALFSATGFTIRLDNEAQMHAFTGAVGSGIAFGYVFAEAIADGAVAEGLPRPLARRAAALMLHGAAQTLLRDGGSPGALKDAVCSPSGTTIEGIAALERLGLRGACIEAVRAASRRSRQFEEG